MDDMIIEFASDMKDLLTHIEEDLMDIDEQVSNKEAPDSEQLNNIFRNLHTIKGTCSFFEMNVTRGLSHKMEDLLDLFRQGRAQIIPEHIQMLFEGIDCLNQICTLTSQRQGEESMKDEAEALKEQIAVILNELKASSDNVIEITENNEFTQTNEPEINKPPAQEEEAEKSESALDDDMFVQFGSNADEMLSEAEQILMKLEKDQDIPYSEALNQVKRVFHTLKGNASFLGLKGVESLTHALESAIEELIDSLVRPDGFQVYFNTIDELRKACKRIGSGRFDFIPDSKLIDQLLSGQNLEAADIYSEAEEKQYKAEEPEKSPNQTSKSQSAKKHLNTSQDAFVRVPVSKLDMLMDLLGEVILVAAMITHHPDLKNLELEGFENTAHQMDLLLRQLQDSAMSLRLIPISNVFQRMKRLVRDFVQQTGKKIDLTIVGEDTEVDKSVAELLNDPLVHLLRNSADHGIESVKERKSAGKPLTGHITLTASQSGGEFRIVVVDDGKGLNRSQILAKARERGLCGLKEEPDDRTVWSYIFNPGFSTAEKITNISGRGVGMDVVLTNIKSMRGKVSIDSTAGKGSSVSIHIPLTLAIMDGMVIRVGKVLYVLPVESIIEILQPRENQISRSSINDQYLISIRNELVPVLCLKKFYDQSIEATPLSARIVLVIETDGHFLALPVDELMGQQQVVIKPLAGHLKEIRAVAGCALLGTGNVAMVLDMSQLYDIYTRIN
ncbi:two-component system, chemotaxis family, sensor kinase CheA [Candidatus Magnetomoraceae bacterium gMMP-15]